MWLFDWVDTWAYMFIGLWYIWIDFVFITGKNSKNFGKIIILPFVAKIQIFRFFSRVLQKLLEN